MAGPRRCQCTSLTSCKCPTPKSQTRYNTRGSTKASAKCPTAKSQSRYNTRGRVNRSPLAGNHLSERSASSSTSSAAPPASTPTPPPATLNVMGYQNGYDDRSSYSPTPGPSNPFQTRVVDGDEELEDELSGPGALPRSNGKQPALPRPQDLFDFADGPPSPRRANQHTPRQPADRVRHSFRQPTNSPRPKFALVREHRAGRGLVNMSPGLVSSTAEPPAARTNLDALFAHNRSQSDQRQPPAPDLGAADRPTPAAPRRSPPTPASRRSTIRGSEPDRSPISALDPNPHEVAITLKRALPSRDRDVVKRQCRDLSLRDMYEWLSASHGAQIKYAAEHTEWSVNRRINSLETSMSKKHEDLQTNLTKGMADMHTTTTSALSRLAADSRDQTSTALSRLAADSRDRSSTIRASMMENSLEQRLGFTRLRHDVGRLQSSGENHRNELVHLLNQIREGVGRVEAQRPSQGGYFDRGEVPTRQTATRQPSTPSFRHGRESREIRVSGPPRGPITTTVERSTQDQFTSTPPSGASAATSSPGTVTGDSNVDAQAGPSRTSPGPAQTHARIVHPRIEEHLSVRQSDLRAALAERTADDKTHEYEAMRTGWEVAEQRNDLLVRGLQRVLDDLPTLQGDPMEVERMRAAVRGVVEGFEYAEGGGSLAHDSTRMERGGEEREEDAVADSHTGPQNEPEALPGASRSSDDATAEDAPAAQDEHVAVEHGRQTGSPTPDPITPGGWLA